MTHHSHSRALVALACALRLAARALRRLPGAPDHARSCPWGAGGGTDATARIIGTLLEKELGQPVNVVNRTGGSGVVGHSAIAQARRPTATRSASSPSRSR